MPTVGATPTSLPVCVERPSWVAGIGGPKNPSASSRRKSDVEIEGVDVQRAAHGHSRRDFEGPGGRVVRHRELPESVLRKIAVRRQRGGVLLEHTIRQVLLIHARQLVTKPGDRPAAARRGIHAGDIRQAGSRIGRFAEHRSLDHIGPLVCDRTREPAAFEEWRLEPAPADFDRYLRTTQFAQPSRIRKPRRRIVGQADERAAECQAFGARVEEVELHRDLDGILCGRIRRREQDDQEQHSAGSHRVRISRAARESSGR